MSEQYDLKKSASKIGHLYPVLVDKDGDVIDGFHRLEADEDWFTITMDDIDTEEKRLIARCVANWHRRKVPREEKEEWINTLAEIYKKQGLKVRRKRTNEILEKIVGVTGLHPDTVRLYLSDEFKQTEQAREVKPRLRAEERIEHELGEDYVERHREEVQEESLEDSEFLEKAMAKGIEKGIVPKVPPKVKPPEVEVPEIPEEEAEEMRKRHEEIEEERERRRKDPELIERSKIFKNWMAHTDIAIQSLRCPVCGKPAKKHLRWTCHPDNSIKECIQLLKEKLEG